MILEETQKTSGNLECMYGKLDNQMMMTAYNLRILEATIDFIGLTKIENIRHIWTD